MRTASQALYDLGITFPTLVEELERVGRDGETVQALVDYARSPRVGSGGLAAARFLLALYNPAIGRRDPELAFELGQAICCWDAAHREAFAAWAQDPYVL